MGTAGTLAAGAVVAAPLAFVAAAGAATNASIKWEAEMANVQKTAGAATDVAALGDSLLQLSTIPGMPAKEDLASIAEMAGSLGVNGTQNVETFTEAVAHATSAFGGLTAGETATQLAKMENVFGIDVSQTENLASAIDWVGNNLAATEAETMAAMQKMSGLGAMYGMTASEAAGLSGSLVALGMDADSAGTLMSSLMTKATDTAQWGKMGELVGMTAEEFGQLATTDVDESILQIAEALEAIADPMERAQAISDLGLGIQESKPLLKMVGHTEEIRANMEGAGKAFEEGTGAMTTFNAKAETSSALITAIGHQVGVIAVGFGSSIRDSETFHGVLEGVYGTLDKIITNMDTIKGLAGHLASDLKSGLSWLYEASPLDDIANVAGAAAAKWNIGDRIWGGIKEYAGTAGEESGEEFAKGIDVGTEDIPEDLEKTLEEVDAEGAGEEAGGAYGTGFSEEFMKSLDSMHKAGMRTIYENGVITGYESRSSGPSNVEVGSIELGEKNPLTVKYSTGTQGHILQIYDSNGKQIASTSAKFTSLETVPETLNRMMGQIVTQSPGLAEPIEAVTPDQIIELSGKTIITATEEILDPYQVWGSPQHMASQYAEYAREGIEEPSFNSIYNITRNLEEEGKAGMMQAWQTILDPNATQAEVDAAFSLLLESDVFGGWGRDVGMAYRDGLIDSFDGVYIDFADEMEKIAQEGADVFSDNFVGEDEAQTMIDRLTWAMTQDPAAFEEAGGKTALQYWEGLQAELDKLEALITAEADPSQIADQRALIAQIIGDHPYQIQVDAEVNAFGGPLAQGPVDEDGNPITLASLLFGTDADRRREIEREDLWFNNEVRPLLEDHIDTMLADATSGYKEDYAVAKANAELLYDLQDEYGQKYLTLRQNQLITALRQGEIGIMAFNEQWDKLNAKQEESKKKVDELSDKYGNLAKTTAESGEDCCEAMSAFGKAQEASSDMFFGSYIGPKENYVPWLAETGEYDKRISVGFDFPDDIDQQVAEYLASHPAEMEVNLKELDKETSDKWLAGLGLSTDFEINPPSEEDIFGVVNTIEETDATITPGADLNQDDLYNIVTEINTTETAIPVGLNANAFWSEYSAIVNAISNWRIYIPVDVDVVANIPALASQIKAEILAGLQS